MIRSRLIPFLCLSLLLAIRFPVISAQTPRLVVEPGSLHAWNLVRGSIVGAQESMVALRIVGRTWEGDRRLLFETASEGSSWPIDMAFWLDEEIASAILEAGSGDGQWSAIEELPVDFSAGHAASAPPEIPLHQPRTGHPPASLELAGDDAASIAAEAAGCLGNSPAPTGSVLVLGGLVLAIALAALPGPRRRMGRPAHLALAVALSAGVATASIALLPPANELFLVALPQLDKETRLSGRLDLTESETQGFLIHRWGLAGEDHLGAIRTTRGQGLPLVLVAGLGTAFRFAPPPLVVNRKGELFLHFDGLARFWSIDETAR